MNNIKLKVVWLCHFTNKEVQERINPNSRINEFAPWIPTSIKIFENNDRIDLHIVSPHGYIVGIKTFRKQGINYYFYNLKFYKLNTFSSIVIYFNSLNKSFFISLKS